MRFLFLIVLAFSVIPQAFACRYDMSTWPPTKSELIKRTFEDSEYIFKGRLLSAIHEPENGLTSFRTATLEVIEDYQGKLPRVVQAYFDGDDTPDSCGGEDMRPHIKGFFAIRINYEKDEIVHYGLSNANILAELPEEKIAELIRPIEKKYVQNFPVKNMYLMKLEPIIFREKKEQYKPLEDEAQYKDAIKKIIRSCKEIKSVSFDVYYTDDFKKTFYSKTFINISFLDPEEINLFNKTVKVNGLWIPYQAKADDTDERYLSPYLFLDSGEIYQLDSCEFPPVTTFFEAKAE